MKYDVPLPRVVDQNGNELRRLNVIDASVSLSLQPLSTAQIMIPLFENLEMRELVQMYTSQGFAGVFRVRSPGQNYRMESKQYALDHAIVELGDYIVNSDAELNTSARSIINTIFSHYKGSLWILGNVVPTEVIQYSLNHDDVLTALMGVMEQLPDYMMQFNQNTVPWQLNIIRKPQTVTGEGRLSRNVVSARISEDDNSLCTRIVSPDLPNGKMDADTIGTYGVVERFIGKDEDQASSAFISDCNKYLAQHKNPLLSVSLELRDLEQITGESLDGITVGDLYRLALPDYDTTIEQPVISLSWRSVYGDPGAINVMLANEEFTMTSAFHNVAGAGGGLSSIGSTSRSLAKANQKIIREEVKLRETELTVQNAVENLEEAWVEIDAHGVEIGAQQRTTDLLAERVTTNEATLTVQAREIAAKVSYAEFDDLGDRVSSAEASLSVQAGQIQSKVSQTDYNGNTIASLINQTATTILIQAAHINLNGYVTANQFDALSASFNNLISGNLTASKIIASTGNFSNLEITNSLVYGGYGDLKGKIINALSSSASGGTITISSTTLDGSAGPSVNFNIADTQFYRDAVASAETNGWNAARAKVVPPSSGTETSFTVDVPSATQGQTQTYTFTIQKGATPGTSGYASVALGQTVVGRISIGDWYSAGHSAGFIAGQNAGESIGYTRGWNEANAQYSPASSYMNRYGHADMYVKERDTYYPAGNHYWYWSSNDKWSDMYIKS